jgi:endonuclease III
MQRFLTAAFVNHQEHACRRTRIEGVPSRTSRDLIHRLLDGYGQTFAEELGIKLRPLSPSGLFRLLCFALLASARIGHEQALRAARALTKSGWSTPQKMAAATWEQRVKVLNTHGYARYDEKTSRFLGDTSALLLEKYGGDLRKLREAAERDPARERELLKECKGIGDIGADIFFREAQAIWAELYPFADKRAVHAAGKLGLPRDAESLARLVPRAQFARLVAALVRVDLAKAHAEVRHCLESREWR